MAGAGPGLSRDPLPKAPATAVTPDSSLAYVMPEGPFGLLHLEKWNQKGPTALGRVEDLVK